MALTTLLCALLYEGKERSKGQRSVVSVVVGFYGLRRRRRRRPVPRGRRWPTTVREARQTAQWRPSPGAATRRPSDRSHERLTRPFRRYILTSLHVPTPEVA